MTTTSEMTTAVVAASKALRAVYTAPTVDAAERQIEDSRQDRLGRAVPDDRPDLVVTFLRRSAWRRVSSVVHTNWSWAPVTAGVVLAARCRGCGVCPRVGERFAGGFR
jgi:hypothetical protein